ncbi:hypothetical protein GCM10017788_25970 [Amycolatopsis acidiphila]|nr:hypothetical protein GCM10017788_25970 [Amycolatopsis acidiphila]
MISAGEFGSQFRRQRWLLLGVRQQGGLGQGCDGSDASGRSGSGEIRQRSQLLKAAGELLVEGAKLLKEMVGELHSTGGVGLLDEGSPDYFRNMVGDDLWCISGIELGEFGAVPTGRGEGAVK